ncbi:MAG: amidohydrolase family protein [bacterium]|nr:amidohydrolase family protein [bacterium]
MNIFAATHSFLNYPSPGFPPQAACHSAPRRANCARLSRIPALTLLSLLCLLLFGGSFLQAGDALIALKGEKVVTVSGDTLENAIVLIRGEKIEKVGRDIVPPAGCRVLDFPGCTIYPGLINAMTTLGISGTDAVKVWDDAKESGKYNPHLSAASAFYPWSNLIPNTRDFGTLIALTAPTGGLIPGKAALFQLAGWAPRDMFIQREAALIIKLPVVPTSRTGNTGDTPKVDFSITLRKLEKYIASAYKYHQRETQGTANSFDPKLDAMRSLWSKKLPVIISADSKKNIQFALKIGKEYNLKVILSGLYDAESMVKEIKAAGYPAILPSMYTANTKWEDGCDKVLRLPGVLARNGIPFAFSTARSSSAFDLPLHAGRATAYGLSPKDALKGLTQYPAEIFGLPDYGSIEPGKIANLVVTDGCILETSTRVKAVFIKGEKIEAKSYFQKEYRRTKEKLSGEYR